MTEWLSLDSNYSLQLSFHIEICSVHLALVETLLVLGRRYGWVLKWVEMFILAILMIIPMIISFNSDTHIDPSLSSSLSSSLSPSLPWSSSSSSLLTDHYPAPLRCCSCPEKDFFSFIFNRHWPFSTSPAVFLFNREAWHSSIWYRNHTIIFIIITWAWRVPQCGQPQSYPSPLGPAQPPIIIVIINNLVWKRRFKAKGGKWK